MTIIFLEILPRSRLSAISMDSLEVGNFCGQVPEEFPGEVPGEFLEKILCRLFLENNFH